jgi:hypothetical protein
MGVNIGQTGTEARHRRLGIVVVGAALGLTGHESFPQKQTGACHYELFPAEKCTGRRRRTPFDSVEDPYSFGKTGGQRACPATSTPCAITFTGAGTC